MPAVRPLIPGRSCCGPLPGTDFGLRQRFEVETGAPVVAFVGNGFARKGLGPLLQAWPAIKSHPYLLVAGVDRAAPRYIRLAHRLGVGSRVRFLGAVDQVEQLFHAVDAFALPGHRATKNFFEEEGFTARALIMHRPLRGSEL